MIITEISSLYADVRKENFKTAKPASKEDLKTYFELSKAWFDRLKKIVPR